jgi:hypothetical protein
MAGWLISLVEPDTSPEITDFDLDHGRSFEHTVYVGLSQESAHEKSSARNELASGRRRARAGRKIEPAEIKGVSDLH